VAGQNVTLAGAAAVTISADGSQPSAGQIVMGSTGNVLAIFRFTETSNAENVKITQLPVMDIVSPSTSKAAFSNLTLWQGSTLLGTVGSAGNITTSTSNTTSSYTYSFSIAGNPIIVPKANSVSVTLKGDASQYSVGATDNGTNVFTIATSSGLTALGQNSNLAATTTISGAAGNTMTVLRTVLTPSVNNTVQDGSFFIPSNHQARNTSDDLAELKFSTNNSGGAVLTKLTASFSGSLASSTSFLSGVQLLDSNGTDIMSDMATTTNVTVTFGAGPQSATGTDALVINGTNVPTVSMANGSTTAQVTAAFATAINAVSSTITSGESITATSTATTVVISSPRVGIVVTAGTLQAGTTVSSIAGSATACTSTTTCTLTWTIPTSTTQAQISAGGTGLFKLRINDQLGQSAVSNTAMSLSATVQSTGDINYYDSLDNSGNSITSIPTNLVPFTISSFALPLGN